MFRAMSWRGLEMRVLIIDNIDSFVYNPTSTWGAGGRGHRQEEQHHLAEARALRPERLIVSRALGRPRRPEPVAIMEVGDTTPGGCLGHQAIGGLGGRGPHFAPRESIPNRARRAMIYRGLKTLHRHPVPPGRGREATQELMVTARSLEDGISASGQRVSHEGVQFHPESILTGWARKHGELWAMKSVEVPKVEFHKPPLSRNPGCGTDAEGLGAGRCPAGPELNTETAFVLLPKADLMARFFARWGGPRAMPGSPSTPWLRRGSSPSGGRTDSGRRPGPGPGCRGESQGGRGEGLHGAEAAAI